MNDMAKLSDSICAMIQTLRCEGDTQLVSELNEMGYGSSFVPDGTVMTDALISEVERDIAAIRDAALAWAARRDSQRARLETLNDRLAKTLSDVGVISALSAPPEPPRVAPCGHSRCVQAFIDTGKPWCVEAHEIDCDLDEDCSCGTHGSTTVVVE